MIKQSTEKSKRVAQCIESLWFPHVPGVQFMSIAKVPSLRNSAIYDVTVVNGKASHCNCPATKQCVHMDAVNVVLAGSPDLTNYDVLAEADKVREQALADAEIGDAYEQMQKKTSFAYGCCGHIVKVEHEGQLCGACLCK